jgi:hypothetical protein
MVSQKGQLRGSGWLGIESRIDMDVSLGGAGAGKGVAHCAVEAERRVWLRRDVTHSNEE